MEAVKFLGEKLNETCLVVENLGSEALAWFNGVFPPETRAKKVKQCRLAAECSGAAALAWLGKVFPPETRARKISHWLHTTHPCLPAAVALAVSVVLCRFFFGGGGPVKTMKAPGRNRRMARADFASNPKGYFRDLRKKRG